MVAEFFKLGEEKMKSWMWIGILVLSLSACLGCANNPDVAGQVVSGILMGIGAGLSGL